VREWLICANGTVQPASAKSRLQNMRAKKPRSSPSSLRYTGSKPSSGVRSILKRLMT